MATSALLDGESKVEATLARLNLSERIQLLSGNSTWTVAAQPHAGIPVLKLCDGPHAARGDAMRGVSAAAFPVGTAMASTWNESLIEAVGRALGEEAKTKGVQVLLGPTINLQRHPYGGRNFECYSEDPLLTGRIACAFINGVQGQGIAACAKHFVANDAEEDRHRISSDVDDRTLHELYLKPFEMAVRNADVWTVMSSYNRINGIFASSHEALLKTLLKDRWGFAGLVVSDWGAALETIANAKAGLDLEMPGPSRTRGARLLSSVQAGDVAEQLIEDSARRVLRVIDKTVGLRTPGSVAPPTKEQAVDTPAHRALARTVAREAMVLLRNEPVGGGPLLPLDTNCSLAVLGPNAVPGQIQGGGSSQVFPHYQLSPLDGLKVRFPTVSYAPGARNHKYVPVPPQSATYLPDKDQTGLSLTLYSNPDMRGEPLYDRALSARLAPWGFIPLGLPGREDTPFDESPGFSAILRFDYEAAVSGRHALGLQSAGLAKLYVNDELKIDNWNSQEPGDAFFGHGSTEQQAEFHGEAGQRYAIRIEFRSDQKNTFLQGVRYGIEPNLLSDEALIAEAVAVARQHDACVLVVGSNSDWETEGNDRRSLALPGRQDELVERVLAANPKTIVVVNGGAPLAMPWFDQTPAVLQAWLPGQEFGNALADLISGDHNPSGRLAQTLPRAAEDAPSHPYFFNDNGHLRYGEGLLMGYRGYLARGTPVRAPFGFGLSYTRFTFDALQVDIDAATGHGRATVTVSNVGERAGKETVQLYLSDETGTVEQPPLKLVGFAQVDLSAGASADVSVRLDRKTFAYWATAAEQWLLPAGEFVVKAGPNVADLPLSVSVEQVARALD